MILAGTGHLTTEVMTTGKTGHQIFVDMVNYLVDVLPKHNPSKIISGMSLGWDQALAQASLILHIPLIACCPFMDQDAIWSESAQRHFRTILALASEVVIVSPGGYSPEKMQKRNEWMVDHCDLLLALWNGSPGGTKNTLDYAERVDCQIINLWGGWNANYA